MAKRVFHAAVDRVQAKELNYFVKHNTISDEDYWDFTIMDVGTEDIAAAVQFIAD